MGSPDDGYPPFPSGPAPPPGFSMSSQRHRPTITINGEPAPPGLYQGPSSYSISSGPSYGVPPPPPPSGGGMGGGGGGGMPFGMPPMPEPKYGAAEAADLARRQNDLRMESIDRRSKLQFGVAAVAVVAAAAAAASAVQRNFVCSVEN